MTEGLKERLKNAMKYLHNKELTERAQKLRKQMTPTERKLWYCFLKDHPVKFYRQRVIGDYIADFYCSKAKLVVEIDGYFHYSEERKYYEQKRDFFLRKNGFRTLRFTNANVDEDFQDVCRIIDCAVREKLNEEV